MSKDKKKNNKRTGLGTGQACMGLNIKNQEDCPFRSYNDYDEFVCNLNGVNECDLDNCKLKEFGRIIVDWVK